MLKKSTQKGFTIVELLIVIVVIGILAALVLNTFAGIQQRARDTERKTDVNSIATQLEAYYNLDGEGMYPLLADVDTTTLEGLDEGALEAPNGAANSLVADATPEIDEYGYITLDGATPQAPCTTGATCGTSFILYWQQEEDNSPQEKKSLN